MLRQPYLNTVTMAVITKETDVNDAFQMKSPHCNRNELASHAHRVQDYKMDMHASDQT